MNMSNLQIQALYSCVFATVLAISCWWLSTLADDSRASRVVSRFLGSWFLSTRWSLEPRRRLRMMAIVIGIVALVMLYVVIADPPPRFIGSSPIK